MYKPVISIEGIDGSGKSTICKMLSEELSAENTPISTMHEPVHEDLLNVLHNMLTNTYNANTIHVKQMLYAIDRQMHQCKIQGKLNQDGCVILDRYTDSMVAYAVLNASHRHMPEDELNEFAEWTRRLDRFTIQPTLTILLKVNPETAYKRICLREGKMIVQDCVDDLKKLDEIYTQMVDERGFVVIDANRPFEEVYADVKRAVLEELKKI